MLDTKQNYWLLWLLIVSPASTMLDVVYILCKGWSISGLYFPSISWKAIQGGVFNGVFSWRVNFTVVKLNL